MIIVHRIQNIWMQICKTVTHAKICLLRLHRTKTILTALFCVHVYMNPVHCNESNLDANLWDCILRKSGDFYSTQNSLLVSAQMYIQICQYSSTGFDLVTQYDCENALSEVGFEPTPGEPDCDLNAAP